MRKSKFVNGNRTKQQRRVRYCFLSNLGLNRTAKRILVGYSDKIMIRTLEALFKTGVLR